MSNLGYFQLKGGPSSYNLTLAPGRSQELYTILNDPSDQVGQYLSPDLSSPAIDCLSQQAFSPRTRGSGFKEPGSQGLYR